MEDSIYHMTLRLILLAISALKCRDVAIRKLEVFNERQSLTLRSNLHI